MTKKQVTSLTKLDSSTLSGLNIKAEFSQGDLVDLLVEQTKSEIDKEWKKEAKLMTEAKLYFEQRKYLELPEFKTPFDTAVSNVKNFLSMSGRKFDKKLIQCHLNWEDDYGNYRRTRGLKVSEIDKKSKIAMYFKYDDGAAGCFNCYITDFMAAPEEVTTMAKQEEEGYLKCSRYANAMEKLKDKPTAMKAELLKRHLASTEQGSLLLTNLSSIVSQTKNSLLNISDGDDD